MQNPPMCKCGQLTPLRRRGLTCECRSGRRQEMTMSVMRNIRALQGAIAAGDPDSAAVALHRLPDIARPPTRAELARLWDEIERMARFDERKAGCM